MKRSILGVLGAFLLNALPPSAFAQSGERMLAVVDVQKTMEATAHWKSTVDRLEKERVGRQTRLESKQKELRARKEKLDAKRAVTAPKALVAEEEALFRDAQALTEEFMRNQQELTDLEKHATAQMLNRIEALVQELSVSGEYEVVFETGSPGEPNVLYADPKLDLTQQVIALYQKHFKDKPLEAPSAKGKK